MGEQPIRVWLEPGYDHGRTGAWMLDWPGAFCWGVGRSAALARAHSAVSRFVEWLSDHGEETATVAPVEPVVVEEVAAVRMPDGYEVNAIFTADDRPVSTGDLDAAVRWLGFARADLVELADRVHEFEAGGGRLPVEQRGDEALASGASDGRMGNQVLRHVGGAEAWFVSRLDASARYVGAPRDGELAPYLEETRAFLVDGLGRLQAADPAASRTDGKGEEWTLFKVLRRAVYHSLDHLEELDRRLAVAEHRVNKVVLRRNAAIDGEELRSLFASAGLIRRARDSAELNARMAAASTETISAWDGQRLIGFGRLISDETTNAYITTVAVAPRWQDRGLGRRLMETLMEGRDGLKLILDAREGVQGFYERLGFEPARTAMVRPRRG